MRRGGNKVTSLLNVLRKGRLSWKEASHGVPYTKGHKRCGAFQEKSETVSWEVPIECQWEATMKGRRARKVPQGKRKVSS